MNREKPSHKRIDYKLGKTESIVMERDLHSAKYRIIIYKQGGVGIVHYRNTTKEATELFNELLKDLK